MKAERSECQKGGDLSPLSLNTVGAATSTASTSWLREENEDEKEEMGRDAGRRERNMDDEGEEMKKKRERCPLRKLMCATNDFCQVRVRGRREKYCGEGAYAW